MSPLEQVQRENRQAVLGDVQIGERVRLVVNGKPVVVLNVVNRFLQSFINDLIELEYETLTAADEILIQTHQIGE